MTDPLLFRSWLVNAQPGDRTTYYVGALAEDRANRFRAEERRDMLAAATEAAYAFEAGMVTLVQRRAASGRGHEYIAIRRKDRR